MTLSGKKIGFALTGSFCTYEKVFIEMKKLIEADAEVYPIFSITPQNMSCRFGCWEEFYNEARAITGHEPITTIATAEPIGPKSLLDILIIAPCTGNTISKLANAITDTPVLMAAKAHLRNEKPLVISVSTNDALSMNFKNIGTLFNCKNIYFVPFGQDDFVKKPNSMIADTSFILPTLEMALEHKQIQPVVIAPKGTAIA